MQQFTDLAKSKESLYCLLVMDLNLIIINENYKLVQMFVEFLETEICTFLSDWDIIVYLRATVYIHQAKSSNVGTSAEIDFLHILPIDSPSTA